MKYFGVSAAALSAFMALTSLGHAEIVNIPASSGMMGTNPGQGCFVTNPGGYDWAIYADPNAQDTCVFEIPLNVPVGHTVKQITVLYGTDSQVANPGVSTYLASKGLVAPYTSTTQFDHWLHAYVPDGTVQAVPLMNQFGKNFPDAFIVQANTLYRVGFLATNGVSVWGISVNYE